MLPQSQPEDTQNSSKINLLISLVFHVTLVLALVFFAAREGLLGKQLHKISVEMVREKPPEKPKEAEKPKTEPPKVEAPKTEPKLAAAPRVETPKPVEVPASVAVAPPAVAPPPAELPSLEFGGGRTVQSSSDPEFLYKSSLESALRAKWNRPEDAPDDHYVDEVEVSVDGVGDISAPTFKKNSGDARWDGSVMSAIASVKNIGRAPPPGFPPRVVVRFDVADTETITP